MTILKRLLLVSCLAVLGLLGLGVTLFSVGPVALAGTELQAEPSHIGFTLLSGSVAWLDNNNACAATPLGPRALWLEIAVTNNHTTETLTGITLELSGFASRYYKLTADPKRYVGNLAPGETYYGYWYVDYSGVCAAPAIHGLSDTYLLTAQANNLSAPAIYSGNLTTQSSTGVGAGDIITSSRSSSIAIGQVFTQTAVYELPNSDNVLLQPTGNADFADACFRLVGSAVAASNVSGIPANTFDQLYFPTVNGTGRVTMIYYWQAQCRAESTSRPWANSFKGNSSKYSNKYGVYFTTFPPASLSLQVTSMVAPIELRQAGPVTYTVRFTNVFTQPVELNTITVTLASGLRFHSVSAMSDVDAHNSSLFPAVGATGMLLWRGIPGLSYRVPGASGPNSPGVLELVFTVQVPASNGSYTQRAYGKVGKLSISSADTVVIMNQPTAITLAAFDAAPHTDGIHVTWETAAELDNLGFNLYRSASASGPWTWLNANLIPPQFPGQVYGGDYEWLDMDVQPGSIYYYRLEDVDRNGTRTFHGPVWVVLGGARYRVYLPLVVRP